jgi:UDP-glucuronate decarboxylase
MNSPDEVTGPINIGNPREFSILELAQKILVITGSKSKLVKAPLPDDDPKQRQPDITLAGKLLGWRPTVELTEGLQATIAYFEELLREYGKGAVPGVKLSRATPR